MKPLPTTLYAAARVVDPAAPAAVPSARVAPLIQRAGLSGWAAWRTGASLDSARAQWLLLHAARLVEALEASQIPVALLKGADLASRCWPVSTLREMTDLDLLVRPADVDAAAIVLAREGLVQRVSEGAHHQRWEGSGVCVELHTMLFNPPHGLRIDMCEVFDRRTRIPLAAEGVDADVLDPVDAAVHVAAHAAYSDALATLPALLRSPLDLGWLLERCSVDAAAFWRRCREWGVTRAVRAFAEISASLFPGLRAWRDAGPAVDRLALRVSSYNARAAASHEPTPPASVSRALLAPGWLPGMRVFAGHGIRSLKRRGTKEARAS